MIRLHKKAEADRRPLREVLGLPESSGSVYGSTKYKRAAVCPRSDRLYELGVRKSGAKMDALDFGDAYHLVLERYYGNLMLGMSTIDAVADAWKTIDKLRAEPGYDEMNGDLERVLTAYFERAEKDEWQPIAVEEELVYRGLDFDYSTRLDLVFVERGEMWIGEHKSTKVITDDMMTGYMLDLQTIGQIWTMRQCVDLTQYPPFAGVCVNIISKQTTPRLERVRVRATEAHLREFERHLALRAKMNQYAASLGYPKMFGNCSGPAQYFKQCVYFDICHGQPDFDIAGVDKLTSDDLPFGFVVVDTKAAT